MTIQVQEQSRHVVLVTLDHQPRRNAMTRPMLAELARLWDTFERASYRCIILTGAGEQAFCAGADMSGDLSVEAEEINAPSRQLF
jgi:enoyl-CoA hydratase